MQIKDAERQALERAALNIGTTAAGYVRLCIELQEVLAPLLLELAKDKTLRKPNTKRKTG